MRTLALSILLLDLACGDPDPRSRDGGWTTLEGSVSDHDARRDGGGPAPDAAADGAPGTDAPVPLAGPARYGQTTHSPITSSVAANLRAIAAADPKKNDQVFAKVGASNSLNSWFMHCLAGSSVSWGTHGALAATVAHYKSDLGGGVTPFDRDSLCTVVGWPAHKAIAGTPSPLQQEVSAISPRVAVVMYGTNDIGYNNIWQYGESMLTITDGLIGWGVVPVLTTIPPRADSTSANLEVPRYNAVARAVGQARQVPVIDLHRELLPLPQQGLGSDGIHMNAKSSGCDLTSAGLQYGFNVRNLLTLEALARVKAALEGAPAPDPATTPLYGAGTGASPYLVDGLPFSDLRNTAGWPERKLAGYSCAPTIDESGPEVVYRLELQKQTSLRAIVFDQGEVDIDLHLLDASGSAAGCLARDDKLITKTLQPGTYHLVLDSYVKSGVEKAGEYLLLVLAD
jgi:hypothetical protein